MQPSLIMRERAIESDGRFTVQLDQHGTDYDPEFLWKVVDSRIISRVSADCI